MASLVEETHIITKTSLYLNIYNKTEEPIINGLVNKIYLYINTYDKLAHIRRLLPVISDSLYTNILSSDKIDTCLISLNDYLRTSTPDNMYIFTNGLKTDPSSRAPLNGIYPPNFESFYISMPAAWASLIKEMKTIGVLFLLLTSLTFTSGPIDVLIFNTMKFIMYLYAVDKYYLRNTDDTPSQESRIGDNNRVYTQLVGDYNMDKDINTMEFISTNNAYPLTSQKRQKIEQKYNKYKQKYLTLKKLSMLKI